MLLKLMNRTTRLRCEGPKVSSTYLYFMVNWKKVLATGFEGSTLKSLSFIAL